MTLDSFFEKFDLFADAPGAVAKMRELVLELAVQGKLSEQQMFDAEDPTWLKVSEQLDGVPEVSAHEVEPPFQIPSCWTWTTLDRLGDTKPRNDAPDSARSSFTPMTLIPADYGQSARHEERPWGEVKKGYTHFRNGDVVMAKITPCFENGKSAVMNGLTGGFGAGTTELHVFRKSGDDVLPEFVLIYLKTRGFITRGIPRMTGSAGQKRVPSDYFARSPFPLPPLAEQKRIVAKVDELMALCDQLETQQQERQARHTALARASLSRFADAPTPANLDFIFHPSYDITPADLRKSILTLAVQGKLVPQDPNDELAEGLIAESDADGNRDQGVEKIPSSWALSPLREVAAEIVDCPHSTPKWTDSGKICVRTSQFKPGFLDLTGTKFVSEQTFEERVQRLRPQENDILYSREGGILGIACRVPATTELCLGQRMMLIRVGNWLSSAYLELVLNAPLITEIARMQTTGGAAPRVNVSTVKSYPIPVPPLAEQRRIVVKVDQLMALVDKLETQLAANRAAAANLLSALVAELTTQE